MKKYELMMIIDPTLAEADRDTLIASIESELSDHDAKVVSRNHPGEQTLAYRIHGSQKGYYLLYILEHEGSFVEVSNNFNIKKEVWRYMFTRVEE